MSAIPQRLAYWLERRAWLMDMRPDDHARLARIDCLIRRLAALVAPIKVA